MSASLSQTVPGPTALTRCVTAENPSGMTLTGTNTYVVAAPGSSSAVIVDPGPVENAQEHWDDVALELGDRTVELILITHRHHDHTGAVDVFAQRSSAPVRAVLDEYCRDASPLIPHTQINVAGVTIQVLDTPGHTSDSVCFFLPEDTPSDAAATGSAAVPQGSVLTGDTILGEGTTMLDHPDGTLADYFVSLDLLGSLPNARVLPAHGPSLDSVHEAVNFYRERRQQRVHQLASLVQNQTDDVVALTDIVYPHLLGEPAETSTVRSSAEKTVAAHLRYLRRIN